MEGRSAVWLLAALLLEALISAEPKNSLKYLEVGDKLVLRPERVSGSIRSVTWRLNGSIVGTVDGFQPFHYSPPFIGRASLDKTTGVLEISNMMKNESGKYTVLINDDPPSERHVRVIKQVPKPVVMLKPPTCSKELKSCSVSCGGDVTEAGPVTFYFKKGDGDWKEYQQDITVMNNATTQAFKTFSCRMENPLAPKDSEPVENPFYVEGAVRSNAGRIVGSVVVLLIAAVAAGVVLCSA